MNKTIIKEGRTAAIIAYVTFIGTIIAFAMNNKKKNKFTKFHIRQMMGILLIAVINKYIIYDFVSAFAAIIIFVILLIFWLIGFFGAIRSQKQMVPYLGETFQRWFSSI